MSPSVVVLCLLVLHLHTGAKGFGILPGSSLNHQEITQRAILNTAVQVCHAMAQTQGTDFTFPAQPFTAENVAVACGAPQSSKSFRKAINLIQFRNIRVDIRYALSASFHFDEEMFVQGRKIITEGILAVKASNKQENFEAAQRQLGEIFHPLQDFYSHSNWVELGNKIPNANLIKPDTSIGNIAASSRATCRSCDGGDCRNNILEDIIKEGILTSGYFGVVPFFSTKPEGKCSHGGLIDQTSNIAPKGGINKDTLDASHGHLHNDASNVAIAATSELLDDIRRAAGDGPFLQMVGISKRSNKGLGFVVDTTQSMSDHIAAVKNAMNFIINSEVGTENEPSVYILVSFNDPDFGLLMKTTDPENFKSAIDSLSASGGEDEEELGLSGLQMALANAPTNSELFFFTDAPAKDKYLKGTVIALIERSQTVVNFLIFDSTSVNRRRRHLKRHQQNSRIVPSEAQLYRDLAQASGGQAIEVTDSELPEAISTIMESLSSSQVTLLQAARNPGKEDNFLFIVDESLTNPTVYITGRTVTFTVTSPTGESQQSTDTEGSLITTSKSVGNLITLQLKKHAGQWTLKMASTNPYTLKVIGQSPVDFLFDFVEALQGPFSGFDALDTRPKDGVGISLLVSLSGSDTATVTEASLVALLGSEEVKGIVEPQDSRTFLVQVDKIPSVEFVVRVKGQDDSVTSSFKVFQRQSSTNFRPSNLTITADSNSILVPGVNFSVPFSVKANETGGNFTIRATNSRRFESTFPTSLYLNAGNNATGTVTLLAPLNIPSGSDVTLTIEAEAPGGVDTNYVVLRLSIVNTVTDFTNPKCTLQTLQSNCLDNCSSATWNLFAQVTDGPEGTGVDRVSLQQGNGTLNTILDVNNENITLVSYSASCCAPDMELMVVDRVGNVGSCFFSLQEKPPSPLSRSTKVIQSPFLCFSTVVIGLQIMTELGIQ